MRQVGLLLCVAWFSLPAFAASPAGPHIDFVESVYDFGTTFRGKQLTHDFAFKNNGNAPLMIVGTHSGCGCTAAETDQNKQYRPGEAGTIRISFDSSDFSGKITKVVTVMTNEKVTPMRTLTIRADLQEEFVVSPPIADFGTVKPEDTATKKIRIIAAEGKVFKVQKVKFDQNKLNVDSQELANNAELSITLRPGLAPGPLNETIYVRNNSKNLKEVPIFVTATILGNIQPSTNRLTFGSVDKQKPGSADLELNAKKEFKLLNIVSTLYLNGSPIPKTEDFITLKYNHETGTRQKVAVALRNDSNQAGVVHGELKLTTDDPAQKEIVVELRGFFE